MKKQITVTTSWDDGHKLDIRLAKLLKKYTLKATFYISAFDREFAKSDLLTSRQINDISSSQIEIGAHTLTHPRLTKVSTKVSFAEIKKSKIYLEKIIGKKITSFCYPGGKYNLEIAKQVKKAGFKLGRTTKTFDFGLGKNPYELPTTIHAYDHWLDIWKVFCFVQFNPIYFWKYYRHWDKLAKAMFDRVLKNGGVYHLWGHSWEIENGNDWKKLESVFKYISNNKNVGYKTNGELYD